MAAHHQSPIATSVSTSGISKVLPPGYQRQAGRQNTGDFIYYQNTQHKTTMAGNLTRTVIAEETDDMNRITALLLDPGNEETKTTVI